MLKGFIEAIQEVFPIESPNYIVNVSNLTPRIKPDLFLPETIKKYKLEGRILTIPIYGDITITDKEGRIVSKKHMKLAEVPARIPFTNSYLTGKGKEVNILGQLRFKPGIYTVIPSSGVVKTTFHLKGTSFHLVSDAGKLYFRVDSKHFAAYPILKFFGVTDDEIVNNFGKDFFENNKVDLSPAEIERLVKRFYKAVARDQRSESEIDIDDVLKFFSGDLFDPAVNKITLGQEITQLNRDVLIQAVKKFLKVSRGEIPPDQKDLIIFKRYYDADDFIKERINSIKWQIKRKIQRNVELHPDDPRRVIPAGMLSKPAFDLLNSSIASMEKYTNPLSIIAAKTKWTFLGEGGLQTEYAATPEMRNFNFSMLGTLDPIQMPESEKIGLVFHSALGAAIDDNKNISKIVFNHKTGKYEVISGTDFWTKNIAFSDQYVDGRFKNPKSVKVINQGQVKYVDASKVDYVIPEFTAFSLLTAMIPMLSSFHPTRALIASKMLGQAIPLKQKEKPLVQSALPPDLAKVHKQLTKELGDIAKNFEFANSFEEVVGSMFSAVSPVDGTVKSVSKDKIVIVDKKGRNYEIPLYNNFPVYPDSFIHQEPIVKPGDRVSKGDPLASSNFTDGKALAIGTNLLAAYIPFKGYNYEDAIVISESAAQKLTSERMIHEYFPIEEGVILNKNKFRSVFPALLLEENARKLDEDGVIKKGSKVRKGEIIIAAMKPRLITADEYKLMRIHRTLVPKYKDVSVIWDRETEGEVVDVHKTKHAISVLIKTSDPAEVGDKLVGRFGEKGIIAYIVPDNEMPRTKDGKVIDIIFNPLSIISRMNTGQIVELALGKIAQKRGEPVYVPLFMKEDYVKLAKKLLKDHGLSDTETLIDPKTGKEIPNVIVGPKYIMKLEHEVKDKLDARYRGSYDMDLAPAKHGEEGAKALDTYTAYGLFAHGALANLKEMATYKAEKNDAFWDAIEHGFVLPAPKPTFAMEKFLAMLKAAGINVEKKGSTFRLLPLTDRDVEEIAKIKVENPRTVSGADLKPEKGGLFDPALGGLTGTRWGYIELVEPLPNPIVEKALMQILGLTKAQFEDLIAGKTVNGIKGIQGLKEYLKRLDIDELIVKYEELAKTARVEELDKYNRILRFLRGLKEAKIKPESLIITKVPVIPPRMRPIYVKDDQLIYSPFNDLYKHLLMANELLEKTKELPEEHRQPLRLKAYEALKALAGLTDPISPAFSKREIRGVLDQIAGPTPKMGYFQSKLIRKEQDLVGRTVIIPEPDLHPDEVGLPYEIAWKIFEPFVIRKLIQQGKTKLEAIKHVEERTPIAKDALEAVAKERLVLLNRAPSLHKYNILAFKPRLIEGNAMKIPPLVVVGFNADFDGDAMTIHTPVTQEALEEARRLLPSNHWLHEAKGNILLMPRHEAIIGIYRLTSEGRHLNINFKDEKEVEEAYKSGKIQYNDIVNVKGIGKTSYGRIIFNKLLPDDLKDYSSQIDGNKLKNILFKVFRRDQKSGVELAHYFDKIGKEFAYLTGYSLSLDDIASIDLSDINKQLREKMPRFKSDDERRKFLLDLATKVDQRLLKLKNRLMEAVNSKARGELVHARQIIAAPIVATDVDDNIIPAPVNTGYSGGMTFSDWILSVFGGRKAAIDKVTSVVEPGAMTKELFSTMSAYRIAEADCGTKNGIEMDLDDADAMDYCLAEDVYVGGKLVAKRNSPLVDDVYNALKSHKVKRVKVRTPLTCESLEGVCQRCYGLDKLGNFPAIGDYVGIKAAEYIGEPMTQLILSRAHFGGTKGSPTLGGFKLFENLINFSPHIRPRATLAKVDGIVEQIIVNLDGSKNVIINGVNHPVSRESNVSVKVGDKVKKGDQISEGIPHPVDVYATKGLVEMRKYLAEQLRKIYYDSGLKVDKRMFDVLAKAMTNTVIITDPGDSDFVIGDRVPLDKVEKLNKTLKNPIKYIPIFRGLPNQVLLSTDWLNRISRKDIKNTLIEGTIRQWTGDISRYPMPAFAYGVELK